ncbi:MAG: hypothetical protein M3198_19385 [Actinomycetota bacterium]|nr:hypothetical protein [Actinomycetota bacterium]
MALRRFFQDVRSAFPRLEGVLLVGNFPEATLVRKVSWSPGYSGRSELWINTELISSRADIVLADLNGNWDALYIEEEFDREQITAVPDSTTVAAGWCDGESVRNADFASTEFTVGRSPRYKDAFFLDDAIYTVLEHRAAPSPLLRVRLNQAERNNEVDVSDRALANIIARPDIGIARVNAYNVALNPNPSMRGADGRAFLDAGGNPQAVSSPSPLFEESAQVDQLFTFRDFDLERRLLISYLDRNHQTRIGAFAHLPFRAGVISGTRDFSPDYYEPLVNAAAADLLPCVKVATADLRQYVQFHKTPAVLKYIIAHSNSRVSEFRSIEDTAAFTAEVGGPPVRWIYRSGAHVPGYDGQGGHADIFVHRGLWHYRALRQSGSSVILHGGCNVNSVDETQSDTYTAPNYGRWNNAEGILFYTNCAALFSRAKGFNDSPWGFTEGYRLGDRANLSDCWRTYYNAQSSDAALSTYNIQRKRAYFWSISGDWTLRLRYRSGLGIISLEDRLESVEIHPNRAWIDGWNFDSSADRIHGIGDLDGDGRDEVVVTSEWGVGILKYNGAHFSASFAAPRDTWFGSWRWDATVNPGRDDIKAVRSFTGRNRSEILVWSSWGMVALELNGVSLQPSRIYENGSRVGGWVFHTGDNVYCGTGQFDADRRTGIVLTSPWGMGILSLERNAHMFMAPNGTRLGGWVLSTGQTRVRLIGDFDGDGMDEILVSSPWGIGVLKLFGGSLSSVAMHANGEDLGGYRVDTGSNFVLCDKLKGGAEEQIVVTDASGIHALGLAGGRLVRLSSVANRSRIGGWVVDISTNRFQPAGDMNGDGSAEFLVRSPWGVGVFGMDGNNALRCLTLTPFGSSLRDWHLESRDVIAGAGSLSGALRKKDLLLIKP